MELLFLIFGVVLTFIFCFVGELKKEDEAMIFFEDEDNVEFIAEHMSHPCIDSFKELETIAPRTVIKGEEDLKYLFYGMVKAYVGNKWNIKPFLMLVQGAITEIMIGLYVEDDRDALLYRLLRKERDAIYYYNRSLLSLLPFGIKIKYNVHYREEILLRSAVQTIKVPLNKYRAMQYLLLVSREEQKQRSGKKMPIKSLDELIDERFNERLFNFFNS